MRAKLNSEHGAALTYALLCFLVCAVVGSVILTAATAAAGRFAGLTESDRRYYAVSSAARLLEDSFQDKKTVVIELEKKFDSTEIRDYSAASPTEPTESEVAYTLKKILSDDTDSIDPISDALSSSELNLFQYASFQYIMGSTVSPTVNETIWEKPAYLRDGFEGCRTIPTLTMSFSADGTDEMKLKLETELEKNGMLTVRFSNDDDTDSYTLRMTMTPDVVLAENNTVDSVSSSVDGSSAETVVQTITATKTYTITWRVLKIDIQRGSTGT